MRDNRDMSNDGLNSPPDGVEGVELKVTLGGTQVDAGLREFNLDPSDAERREIFFCERADVHGDRIMLPLLARGIILRVRQILGSPDDSTVKLRGPEGSVDPDLWSRRTQAFGDVARIEGDWTADRHLVSASLDSEVEGGRIDEVVADRPHQPRRLLSDAQAELLADLLVGLDGVVILDPVHARKWKRGAGRLGAEVVAELWELDDGLRFLELSMRVDVDDDPGRAQRRLEDSVRDRGLVIDAQQQTKSSNVLERLVKAAVRRP